MPLELTSSLETATTEELYREMIRRIGEDPDRDGLLRTPERIAKAMAFLTRGYQQTVEEVLHGALFDVEYDEMVIVKDIEFFSRVGCRCRSASRGRSRMRLKRRSSRRASG